MRPASGTTERRRVVLKLGSRLLTGGSPALLPERIRMYAAAVAGHREVETVIVSSGAVAAGYGSMGRPAVPADAPKRQAAAAVGQSLLMRLYAEAFAEHGLAVAQVLLTGDCIENRKRYVSARNALGVMFTAGVVPIVNENDVVTGEDGRVGDNDNLAAHTAALVDADLLVLLTDVPGVFDRDPADGDARVIPAAGSADELRPFCYRKRSPESRGGMHTKLEAADKAGRYGIPTIIASGLDATVLDAVYTGRPAGTAIAPAPSPLNAQRHWMAVQKAPQGRVVVDDGALRALRAGGSLLARGVVGTEGRFQAGDLVSIVDRDGFERARGITRFHDHEVGRIAGRHSREIDAILGYPAASSVVRSEKVVVLERS